MTSSNGTTASMKAIFMRQYFANVRTGICSATAAPVVNRRSKSPRERIA